ncbi:MAG: HDOD domain-containing protein [Thermodesulfobacteriota bacterium]
MQLNRESKPEPLLAEIIQTLLAVVEGTDMYFRGHYKRMAALCVKFAGKIGLPEREIEALQYAALLHDIGMVYVPADILHKSGTLSADELRIVQQHPVMSARVLANLSTMQPALPIIRHHHEFFDGSGYPEGLTGDRIPLGARLLLIVESYFVMATPRPYRPAKNMSLVLNELGQNKGRRFDGALVDAFLRFMNHQLGASRPEQASEATLKPEEVAREILEQFKRGKIALPVLPNIIREIQDSVDNPNATIDDLADIIKKDAIVSIRLIAAANSPIHAGQQKVRTIREAIHRIGLKETRNEVSMIVSKNLFQSNSREYITLMEEVWLHSLACAYGARSIAEHLGLSEPEKYFLMGMVHDIGKALILKVISDNPDWRKQLDRAQVDRINQIAHNSLGGVVLRHWKFPKEFFDVATSHEGPRYFDTSFRSTMVVYLANRIACEIGYGVRKEFGEAAESDAAKRLKLDADTIRSVSEKVKEIMAECAHSL